MRSFLFGILLTLGLATIVTAVQTGATSTSAAASPLWKIVAQPGRMNYAMVRVNSATGESWLINGSAWKPVPEAGKNPDRGEPGTYEVVVLYPKEASEWYGYRWNVKTGQSWFLDGTKWTDVKVLTE